MLIECRTHSFCRKTKRDIPSRLLLDLRLCFAQTYRFIFASSLFPVLPLFLSLSLQFSFNFFVLQIDVSRVKLNDPYQKFYTNKDSISINFSKVEDGKVRFFHTHLIYIPKKSTETRYPLSYSSFCVSKIFSYGSRYGRCFFLDNHALAHTSCLESILY